MRGMQTDHVISGPMRGLKKMGGDNTEHRDGHCESITEMYSFITLCWVVLVPKALFNFALYSSFSLG